MNKQTFQTQFTGLSEYYNKNLSSVVIGVYWKSLKHLSDEQFTELVGEVIQTCTFFPKVNELLEIAPEPLALENKGSLSWCDNTQKLINQYRHKYQEKEVAA